MSRLRLLSLPVLLATLFVVPTTTTAANAALPSVAFTTVATGFSQPVFATHDGSGNGVLYVVEQPGLIKAVAPGSANTTTFLDIRDRVLFSGEQGLLGLAFRPGGADPARRFYVDYTRQPDGAIVVAEYSAAAPDPAATERVLLTIPKPYANHNGGMLAFGGDGYLYIGTGDGGGGNDPGNRAQDPTSLLGKILRISPDGGTPEVFALGFRNPWRFSFDGNVLLVGDVGQGAREEIDYVISGGNYGWRVYEGTLCTGLGPAPCDPSAYIAPLIEYGTHEGGRCAVTGGYVYRGDANVLPAGVYVYGDFCSGEIFVAGPGLPPQTLLDTGLNISSFGQDANGELLVVDLNGGVYQLTSATAPPPPVTCNPPNGPLSGPLYRAGLRTLAVQLCRSGL